MRIAFAVSEVEDLVKTGGLADVGKALPMALKQLGHDVRIVMPLYKSIAAQASLSDACLPLAIHNGNETITLGVKQLTLHGVTVYLLDAPDYFMRDGLYTDGYDEFPDNGQRFAFFSQAVLVALSHLGFIPDILHCNDWHTGLLPALMRKNSDPSLVEEFANTRSVLTIHNAAFQGVFAATSVPILRNIADQLPADSGGYFNFLQTGLQYSDSITSVSPNYAKELLTDLGSHGLSGVLRPRATRLYGVLNGCDYSQWDPSTDQFIEHHFNADDMAGKRQCKATLQSFAKLPKKAKVPLIGMVCRLTTQKGFGYIMPILERLLAHQVQLVIVGTGDPTVVEQLKHLSQRYNKKFTFIHGFSNQYAHWVEAGCDFFLMPSEFEPCGLNQMYSLAYGTLPIVRAVGGLKDTVVDAEECPESATGFAFHTPQPQALLDCIRRALLSYYEDPKTFATMQHRAMHTRFTWERAAQEYVEIYEHTR
ncbi:glycogen synthase GlgA [Alteromonas facilis]|uniref:glycogen synthase GlgA n=1 Tax=Alteromonas facilis TaxID=2048004 RepID=UPI000C28E49B|nr:glycogen synthase GlgA [Alteromonas facilis]